MKNKNTVMKNRCANRKVQYSKEHTLYKETEEKKEVFPKIFCLSKP